MGAILADRQFRMIPSAMSLKVPEIQDTDSMLAATTVGYKCLIQAALLRVVLASEYVAHHRYLQEQLGECVREPSQQWNSSALFWSEQEQEPSSILSVLSLVVASVETSVCVRLLTEEQLKTTMTMA